MPSTFAKFMNDLLNQFTSTLTGGYVNTIGDVFGLMFQLMVIALIVSAITWGFNRHPAMKELFWRLLGFAVLMWLVTNWVTLSEGVRDGFIAMGLRVGNNVLKVSDILNPGNITDFGFEVTAVVWERLSKLSLWRNSSEVLYSGLAAWCTVSAYLVISVQLFVAILEYTLVSIALLFLVPFLAFEKTAFVGERVFGTIINHALRLLLLALVVNICLPVLVKMQPASEPTFRQCFMLFGGAFIFLILSLSAQVLAYGLVHGGPVLSMANVLGAATSIMQTAAVMGAVGAAAGMAGAGALRGGFSAYGAMREAASVGQTSYRQSHPFTHASRQGRINTMVVGSAQGIGQYAMNRLTSGFTAAINQGRTRARQHLP